MNIWTKQSIELANQRNYLDLLYRIYPMSTNLRRELSQSTVKELKSYYETKNGVQLVRSLLNQNVFPIKDSYVAYLKRDKKSIDRNPRTLERLSGMLFDMDFEEIIDKTAAPKETNRQIGPLFKNWIGSGNLGVKVTNDENEFNSFDGNIVLNTSDEKMMQYAKVYLGYSHNKGLDFIGKFNNKFVIGEAKFLTDFGGHQNAQLSDAINTMTANFKTNHEIIALAILDGVVYIEGNNKMHKTIHANFEDNQIIVSAVLLREFLFSL